MPLEIPPGYHSLDEHSLRAFLADLGAVSPRLGGRPPDWKVTEVGDGNLNLVFLVEGPGGGVCVKQSLPYVRMVGEAWPMTLKRNFFEHEYMCVQAPYVGERMPALYHYDPTLYAIVMERLSPHIIMRHGMIAGLRYPAFVEQVSDFLARSIFFTSDLAMSADRKKAMTAVFCGNSELCKITEDLIFTDPYRVHERNRWTAPELDTIAAEFRIDVPLKLAISRLKLKFLTSAEALIHGDLHTGSMMVTEDDLRVIDAEFAFVGPMAFDVGAVLANLFLAYFSQNGHATIADPRDDYEEWLLDAIEGVWRRFADKFLALWRGHGTGDAYPTTLFGDPPGEGALEEERLRTIDGLLPDTIGFAAAKMIRRILGLAHVIDLERIADREQRALSERRALRLARDLMVNVENYGDIAEVTAAARRLRRCSASQL